MSEAELHRIISRGTRREEIEDQRKCVCFLGRDFETGIQFTHSIRHTSASLY